MINMLYEDLTRNVIGCAMKVHSTLKSGFQEKIYQTALEIELKHNAILFVAEREMDIFYRDQVIGKRRVDFLIENKIVVEIKAVSKIRRHSFSTGIKLFGVHEFICGFIN